MKRFADFGIEQFDDKTIFNVPVISIEEVLNCEIIVLAFITGIKTKHGSDRCIIKVKTAEGERKFFTSSAQLRKDLERVPQDGFPFQTTIKQQRFGSGSGKMYYFT